MALNIEDQNNTGITLNLPNSSGSVNSVVLGSYGSVSGDVPNVTQVYENERERIANENQRIANETSRQTAETLREGVKDEMTDLITEVQTKLDNGDFKGDKGDKR